MNWEEFLSWSSGHIANMQDLISEHSECKDGIVISKKWSEKDYIDIIRACALALAPLEVVKEDAEEFLLKEYGTKVECDHENMIDSVKIKVNKVRK